MRYVSTNRSATRAAILRAFVEQKRGWPSTTLQRLADEILETVPELVDDPEEWNWSVHVSTSNRKRFRVIYKANKRGAERRFNRVHELADS